MMRERFREVIEAVRERRGFLIGCVAMFGALLCAGLMIAILYTTQLSYMYCLFREESWMAAKTEAELDRRIFAFYTKQRILPKDSSWGRDYVLKPGERMIQYMIFGKEPLDVVLDEKSQVVAAFTSYE